MVPPLIESINLMRFSNESFLFRVKSLLGLFTKDSLFDAISEMIFISFRFTLFECAFLECDAICFNFITGMILGIVYYYFVGPYYMKEKRGIAEK